MRGFSLLELLSAIALVGVTAALAVPNLRQLTAPWALDGASRQVASAFQVARQRAITRNVRYRLKFAAPRTFQLERETKRGKFVAEGGAQELPAVVSLGVIKPKTPTFDTRGILAQQAQVSMRTSEKSARTVVVNVLGRTTIE